MYILDLNDSSDRDLNPIVRVSVNDNNNKKKIIENNIIWYNIRYIEYFIEYIEYFRDKHKNIIIWI